MSYRNLAQGRDVLDTKIKWTIVGLAFLTVIVLSVLMVHRAAFSTELNSDFITYRAAGWAVLTGSDIYKVQNPRGWPYVYPPPFAILMTPFAKMSAFTASVIWYLLSVILVVSSVQMAVTMVRGALGRFGRNPFWLYALPFVMVLLWVGQGAVEGQATILTLWLLMLALYRSQRGRDISSGTALACAALLKAFPVAMLAHFIREKRWRLVMATMTALIVGGIALPALVYGWQRNLTYWQEWIAVVAQPSLGDRTLGLQSPTKGGHRPGSQSRQPAKSSPSGGIVAFRGGPGSLPDGSYWFDDGVGDVGGGPTNAIAARSSHRRRVVSVASCYRPGFAFPLSHVGAIAHDRVGVFGAGQY
jgi:Glycosyltransferase family 87